jgi:hypothetical protein
MKHLKNFNESSKSNTESDSLIKEKLKKALKSLKKKGEMTKGALLDFLEGFLRNIDE